MPDASPDPDPAPDRDRPAPVLPAAIACALYGLAGALLVSGEMSYGWDESMHAALPAARIALALEAGALGEAADVVLGCQQYPFVYPALLGLIELVFGVSEGVARAFGRVVWAVGLFGLFLAARAAVARSGWPAEPARARLAPALALALAAVSPLALAYSGTLFQEATFTAIAAWTLWAWLRRDGAIRRELLAGALITAAFFTRFNTGLLLGFALFLDLLVDGAVAARAGAVGAFARRTAWLAAIPVLGFAWWFGLPLPSDLARGAEHRQAFLAFLGGNRGESFRIPWNYRLVDWTLGFAASPRMFALLLIAMLGTLAAWRRPGVRTLWLLFLGAGVPVWTHEFHLDRFLFHQGVAIWILAGLGLTWAARGPRPHVLPGILVLAAVVLPRLDARPLGLALLSPGAEARDYVVDAIAERGDLRPSRRLETNGLRRAEADAMLYLVAAEVGPEERVAWLGISSELSPAALHLGLLARGGSKDRFRRDAARARGDGHPDLCVSFEGTDPGWTPDQIALWSSAFDVVITTRPIDFKGRAARDWVRRYQDVLLTTAGWGIEKLGVVPVARPNRAPIDVEVFACRKR